MRTTLFQNGVRLNKIEEKCPLVEGSYSVYDRQTPPEPGVKPHAL